jgi:Zn-dependent M28 family amino/carboxypeptidase
VDGGTDLTTAPVRTLASMRLTSARAALTRLLAVGAAGLATACSAPAPAAAPVPTPVPAASSVPAAADPGLPGRLVGDVTGDGAFRHLEELQRIAEANGGNRALGTPGYDASVEYVARTLRDAGYTVETPEFSARSFSAQEVRLTVDGTLVGTTVLGFSPATPAGGVNAPLAVLVQDETSGCEAADFAGVPAGAVVLVRRGTCPFAVKSTNAAAARAAAVLVANNLDGSLDQATLGDVTGALPTAGVSKADGDALAGRSGAAVNLVLATAVEERRSRNVLAQTTTGSPDNVVMAGAHLDSVPEGPGINDNGSGTAALVETAVRLGGAPAVPNAVRFAFWGAEEQGLIGSTAYVGSLSDADRQKIALYLNLDMVGSPNAAYLAYDGDDSDGVGAGPGPEGSATVERVLLEQLAATGVTGEGTDFDGRSDYGPFIEAGVPSGGLFTGAEEPKSAEEAQRWGGTAGEPYDRCYHQECDRTDNIDRTALDRNVDALAGTIARFALSTEGIPT